jgi:hypothetical protein
VLATVAAGQIYEAHLWNQGEGDSMGYGIRSGKLVRQTKPKWVTVPYQRDEEWDVWLRMVYAKKVEMFGEDFADTHEQETAAEEALAAEGKHPPTTSFPY